MTEKMNQMIELCKLLPKIVRKRAIHCKIYSRNCNICEYGKNGICEFSEMIKNTRENIMELSKIK